MAFSITKEEILNNGYVPFRYNHRKIGEQNLVVADHGQWVMLNDEEFERLEHEIIENDSSLFSLLEEKGIILTLKNEEIIKNFYSSRMGFLSQGVSLHIVVLTKRCNHNCVYCHASAKNPDAAEYDMDQETAKKTVDVIFQSPSSCIGIEFQGGEPLLNFKVLKYIVKYANEKNKTAKKDLKFSVVSNLQLMDDEKIDFLFREDVSICTSLDGPEEIQNKNRPAVNFSYKQLIETKNKIQERCIKEKKDWNISAVLTVTKAALDKPKEIVDEYVKQGFTQIHVRALNGLGFSKDNFNKIGYSAEEFIEFWKRCVDYIFEINEKTNIVERGAMIILLKILGKRDPNYLEMRSPCGACIGQLAYDHDGSVYSCDEARTLNNDIFKIGTVDQEYKEIVSCDKSCMIITSSIIDNNSCDECAWKPYCGTCPVVTFSNTNSLIASNHEDFRCKIHDAQFQHIFEKIQDKVFRENILKKWFSLNSY